MAQMRRRGKGRGERNRSAATIGETTLVEKRPIAPNLPIVRTRRASFATRNVRHFADAGIVVVDPWSE